MSDTTKRANDHVLSRLLVDMAERFKMDDSTESPKFTPRKANAASRAVFRSAFPHEDFAFLLYADAHPWQPDQAHAVSLHQWVSLYGPRKMVGIKQDGKGMITADGIVYILRPGDYLTLAIWKSQFDKVTARFGVLPKEDAEKLPKRTLFPLFPLAPLPHAFGEVGF